MFGGFRFLYQPGDGNKPFQVYISSIRAGYLYQGSATYAGTYAGTSGNSVTILADGTAQIVGENAGAYTVSVTDDQRIRFESNDLETEGYIDNGILILGGSIYINEQNSEYSVLEGQNSLPEFASAFAAAGYNVAFTWHAHPEAADAVLQQVQTLYPQGRFLAIQADAANPEAACHAVLQAEAEFRRLDVLVCNAGIAQQKLFTELTDEDWRQMMATNLDGVFYACRAVLPGMIRRKYGRILCVSSMWGQVGGSCEAHYSAAKAGVIGLCRALAQEEGPSGITVNCVAPGVIDTDMMAGFSAEDRAALAKETPVGRLGTAEEIARTLVFLASPEAGYITGQVIGQNGGLVIG